MSSYTLHDSCPIPSWRIHFHHTTGTPPRATLPPPVPLFPPQNDCFFYGHYLDMIIMGWVLVAIHLVTFWSVLRMRSRLLGEAGVTNLASLPGILKKESNKRKSGTKTGSARRKSLMRINSVTQRVDAIRKMSLINGHKHSPARNQLRKIQKEASELPAGAAGKSSGGAREETAAAADQVEHEPHFGLKAKSGWRSGSLLHLIAQHSRRAKDRGFSCCRRGKASPVVLPQVTFTPDCHSPDRMVTDNHVNRGMRLRAHVMPWGEKPTMAIMDAIMTLNCGYMSTFMLFYFFHYTTMHLVMGLIPFLINFFMISPVVTKTFSIIHSIVAIDNTVMGNLVHEKQEVLALRDRIRDGVLERMDHLKLTHKDVHKMFDMVDKDQSGSLDKREFRALLTSLGLFLNKRHFDELMRAIDPDHVSGETERQRDREIGRRASGWCV